MRGPERRPSRGTTSWTLRRRSARRLPACAHERHAESAALRAYDLEALHAGTADAILRASDGPSPAYNIELMSLDHFGIQPPAARLITQPGLAGRREQRVLLRLLRGN